jgi:hypothetical protein
MTGKKKSSDGGTAILRIGHLLNHDGLTYEQIEDSVRSLSGVIGVRTNYATHVIEIRYDPQKVSLEKIRESLNGPKAR